MGRTFKCYDIISSGSCGIFTLELYDSWGDGWNGGSLDVVVNGVSYYAGLTILSGLGPETYQIAVDIGDVVDFNYTSGAYAGENSYKVLIKIMHYCLRRELVHPHQIV